MSNQLLQQYALSLVCIAIGLAGVYVPYKWNPLRPKRFLASMIPEERRENVPKIIGTFLVVLGVLLFLGILVFGELK